MPARLGALVLALTFACVVTACGGPAASSAMSPVASPVAAITITDAWVRPAQAGGVSAAYLTIVNSAATDDTLVGVSAPDVTARASLHETTTGDDGMTGMHHAPSIAIPARGSLALQPGGVHVMLEDLTAELTAGETVRIQLAFERAGVVDVDAQVRAE